MTIEEPPRTVLVVLEWALPGALFSLAGMVYEGLLARTYDFDPPIPPAREDGLDDDDDDVRSAYRFADMLDGGPATQQTMAVLMTKTLDILRRNSKAATAIAAELQRVRTMTGATAKEIWAAHGGRIERDFAVRVSSV